MHRIYFSDFPGFPELVGTLLYKIREKHSPVQHPAINLQWISSFIKTFTLKCLSTVEENKGCRKLSYILTHLAYRVNAKQV